MVVYTTSTKSFISFKLPAVAASTGTTAVPSLTTYAAACAGKSKFTATVNNWQGSGTATLFTTGNCVIVNAAALEAEVTGLTAADANLGALSKIPAALSFN